MYHQHGKLGPMGHRQDVIFTFDVRRERTNFAIAHINGVILAKNSIHLCLPTPVTYSLVIAVGAVMMCKCNMPNQLKTQHKTDSFNFQAASDFYVII